MERLEQPFRLYTDAAGKPLDAGYVYFGVAGQNPETSPVTVYWDAAGTIPAAQPLRTSAGYIVRDGTPANVHYSGTYSELVKDKNGVQLFSDLNRTSNPANFLTSLTSSDITAALGYVPVNPDFAEMNGEVRVFSDIADFNGTRADTFTVFGSGTDAAMMQFERLGLYGFKMGLRNDNTFCWGGYSMGTDVYRLTSDTSGNLTALGNVTAYSDLRRKTDIKPIGQALERALQISGFTYLDTVTGQRKIGVGAQHVMAAGFPEAVLADEKGYLSVAYGQLALALLPEVARELLARIAALETELKQLKG